MTCDSDIFGPHLKHIVIIPSLWKQCERHVIQSWIHCLDSNGNPFNLHTCTCSCILNVKKNGGKTSISKVTNKHKCRIISGFFFFIKNMVFDIDYCKYFSLKNSTWVFHTFTFRINKTIGTCIWFVLLETSSMFSTWLSMLSLKMHLCPI